VAGAAAGAHPRERACMHPLWRCSVRYRVWCRSEGLLTGFRDCIRVRAAVSSSK
jgi:hypothetical protein